MENSEPSLVPEWLKNSASVTGVGTLRPHSSSSLHSDDHPRSKLVRNTSLSRSIDQDLGRSSSSERISSSFSRRSYSSNDSAHSVSYSHFGRNYRGRYWDRDTHQYQDRNRKSIADQKEKDVSPRSIVSGRSEKDGIRFSQSVTSARRSEVCPKKPSGGSTVAPSKNDSGGNGLLGKDGYVGSMPKAALEHDFPPLGSEERQGAPEIGRVPSPRLSGVIHPLQSSASAFNNGNKWISALAEAPAAVVGSSDATISSGQQNFVSSSSAQHFSTTTGLNMAEAVALGPLRAQAALQVYTGSQRLEELAIKQCRQLIPVTPASQKPSTLGFDKVKGGGKLVQPHHPTSSLVSPSPRGINADLLKTGNTGKLQVLKPARERNTVPSVVISCNDNSKAPLAAAGTLISRKPTSSSNNSSISPTPQRSSSCSSNSNSKHNILTVLEKRPTSQAKSRNEFFNLIKKKSIPGHAQVKTAGGEEDAPHVPAATLDVPCLDDNNNNMNDTNNSQNGLSSGLQVKGDDNSLHADNDDPSPGGVTTTSPNFSEEEEAALLRSLGWDGNSDEDGLTEEEISDFYRDMMTKYVNSGPSLKSSTFSLPRSATVGDAVSSRLGGSSDLNFQS